MMCCWYLPKYSVQITGIWCRSKRFSAHHLMFSVRNVEISYSSNFSTPYLKLVIIQDGVLCRKKYYCVGTFYACFDSVLCKNMHSKSAIGASFHQRRILRRATGPHGDNRDVGAAAGARDALDPGVGASATRTQRRSGSRCLVAVGHGRAAPESSDAVWLGVRTAARSQLREHHLSRRRVQHNSIGFFVTFHVSAASTVDQGTQPAAPPDSSPASPPAASSMLFGLHSSTAENATNKELAGVVRMRHAVHMQARSRTMQSNHLKNEFARNDLQ